MQELSYQPARLSLAVPDAELLAALAATGCALIRGGGLEEFMARSARLGQDFVSVSQQRPFGGNHGRKPIPGYDSLFFATDQTLTHPLPLHGELYYSPQPPDWMWFYCHRAAQDGGPTWLCDGAELFAALPAASQEQLLAQELEYFRMIPASTWPELFGQADFGRVAASLAAEGVTAGLDHQGNLTTRYHSPAVHSFAGRKVFINNLLPFALRELEEPEATRARVRFADGSMIPAQLVYRLRDFGDRLKYDHHWQAGDTLLIDNRRVLHGRARLEPSPRELWLRMSAASA